MRRDLPNVRNRHDPEAAVLQHSMNPHRVLAALDERAAWDDRSKPAAAAKADAGGKE